jgi:Tripartite tricarboxylate transporter TctB family
MLRVGIASRRSSSVLRQKDVLAGALFLILGALGYFLTRNLDMGTAAMVGSGFMPRFVSVLLILFGAGILVAGLRSAHDPVEVGSPKPLLLVTACIVVFAATLETLGLVPAVLLTVGLSGFAGSRPRWVALLAVGVVLAVACVLIFIWGAKLPIKAGPF